LILLRFAKKTVELLQQSDRAALTELIDSLGPKELVHLIGHLNRSDPDQHHRHDRIIPGAEFRGYGIG